MVKSRNFGSIQYATHIGRSRNAYLTNIKLVSPKGRDHIGHLGVKKLPQNCYWKNDVKMLVQFAIVGNCELL